MKIGQKYLRWIGGYFLLNGLLSLLLGRRYIRLYRFGKHRNSYEDFIDRLLELPSWQLHSAGAVEVGVGLAILHQAPTQVQSFYRMVARGYAIIDPGYRKWFYPKAHLAFDQALSSYLSPNGNILDLGCGVGANLERLLAMQIPFGSYLGVDLTPEMLEQAKLRYAHLQNVSFARLDLMRDTLPDGPFELIVSTWVFEHLYDPVKVANKAWEKLKPGGMMVLLIETQGRSLPNLITSLIYPLIGAHRIHENELRKFPGKVLVQDHFRGLFGNLTLLVLEKPT